MEAREVRALERARHRQSLRGRGLMATRQDEGGSRLWRGMRHLIFGEESEPTLREEIEDAIDEAEESAGSRSPATCRPPSGRCCATFSISASRRPATSA